MATSLHDLAEVYAAMARYAHAAPLHERALRIREEAFGPNHELVAHSLHDLAFVRWAMGQHERAVPMHERALRIREATLGPNHADVGHSLNNLALVWRAMGHYERSLPLFERGLHIHEATLGPNHPVVAQSLVNLAALYRMMGWYERALPLHERALRIQEATLGPDHPDLAQSFNNMAGLYRAIGQYERARGLHERAVRVRERALGPNHPAVAQSLTGLAGALRGMGQHERALPLLERAVRIWETALGPNHPDLAQALNGLAEVSRATGRYDRAAVLHRRALRIRESMLGPTHPNVAQSLNNLAEALLAMEQYERALPLLERALRIREAALGPNHLDVAQSLDNLAAVHQAMGETGRAVPLYERTLNIHARGIQGIASHQQEEALREFLEARRRSFDAGLSFAAALPDDARVRQLALRSALLFKARGEEESHAALATLRRSSSLEDQALLDTWRTARHRIEHLPPTTPRDERERLESALVSIEEQMARRSTAIRERRGLTDLDTLLPRVAARLADDAALVELVSFQPFNPRARTPAATWGPPRYAAFVLHRDGTHAMVDLGDASSLDALSREFTTVLTSPSRPTEAIARAGAALERRLFAPIAPLLRPNERRLVFAPDGPLHLAPLHLMHDGRAWLFDRYTVSYVTSGRDLLRQRSPQDLPTAPLALVATRYRAPAWDRPALSVQADLLPRSIPNLRLLRDSEATEAALQQVAAPRVLHIAAHGQFLDDTSPGAPRTAMARGRLALADADPSQAGDFTRSEGYATAAELLTADLRGTRLVVLSACDTGRGGASAGDGVFGLRRALLLAGAEAVVTTQWSVDEVASVRFTEALYEGLRAGLRSADAVNRAMRAVRARDPDPFAWAPFVLVGRDDAVDWDGPTRPPTHAPAVSDTPRSALQQ